MAATNRVNPNTVVDTSNNYTSRVKVKQMPFVDGWTFVPPIYGFRTDGLVL